MRVRLCCLFALSSFLCLHLSTELAAAQASEPNSNATYQQLRHLAPSGDAVSVQEFELRRDAAVFTFHSGSFAFYGAVNGKITGAVFRGNGLLHLVPPSDQEKHSLSLLTKQASLDETFDTAVLRFTDDTAALIQKAGHSGETLDKSLTGPAQQLASAMRTKLHWNLDERLLEDVLSPSPGGFFLAAIDGKKFASKMIFEIDPHGAEGIAPEEVELLTWNDNRNGVWAAFHTQDRLNTASVDANDTFTIDHQDLDTTLAKNGALTGIAKTTLHARSAGIVVVPLDLYSTLRVSSVKTADGHSLDFIQENKDDDPDFAVILPKPLNNGETLELQIDYAGKDAVINEGNANYYIVGAARDSWYPSISLSGASSYATYHMVFHVPKSLQLIATGKPVQESSSNGITTSEWNSVVPIPVAGFNLGSFKKQQVTLKDGFIVDAYANESVPDNVTSLLRMNSGDSLPQMDSNHAEGIALGNLNTVSMLKPALSQGEVAVGIYTRFFGPLPFSGLALSQQTACNYGQSWPMLVYLPICSFWDTTVRHQLGLDADLMYWKVVTPHEVAHQWWGQTVTFRSYRDQWMSEGFADFSASVFLQSTNRTNKEFRDFWHQERELITQKNAEGFRPIDVGPVTMGYRLTNSRSGSDIYRRLVYPKGAYILHMIRMMGWSPKTGDEWLMQTLQDFVSTYRGQPATTEDFKAILEKHMTPEMDFDGNHKLDWFFNEYVYGTALPHYEFKSAMRTDEKGTTAHIRIAQSNVDASFKMLIPVYAELSDGRTIRLGLLHMAGNSTEETDIALGHPQVPIRNLVINYYDDVLSTQD
jgi:hypothetical protein